MSSIVDQRGEQRQSLEPRRRRSYAYEQPALRERNRRWLATQRLFGLTVRATAEFLNRPLGTVANALAAALAAETEARVEQLNPDWDESPVVHLDSGLTRDELAYLRATYGPETATGAHPAVQAFFAQYGGVGQTQGAA